MTPSTTPLRRAGRWAFDTADGAWGWLVFCGIFAALCFAAIPGDSRAREIATQVRNDGQHFAAVDVKVHVDYEYAKSGGWHEVDAVQVRLSQHDEWRELDAVANDETLSEDLRWAKGWQTATNDTGYEAPLAVVVLYDANGDVVHAVAERDVEYWTEDNHDPEIGLSLGIGSILAGVGGAVGKELLAGLSRRRHDHSRSAGETRAERRASEREARSVWSKRRRHRPLRP